MDLVTDTVAVCAVVVAVSTAAARIIVTAYALRGTQPEDRPQIIRALGGMYRDARPELPSIRQGVDRTQRSHSVQRQ